MPANGKQTTKQILISTKLVVLRLHHVGALQLLATNLTNARRTKRHAQTPQPWAMLSLHQLRMTAAAL